MKNHLLVITVVVGTLLSTHAFAGFWNIGLIGGQSSDDGLSDECSGIDEIDPATGLRIAFSCQADDSATAVGLNLGYQINEVWGVEAGYNDLGEYGVDISAVVSDGFRSEFIDADLTLDASVIYVAGTSTLALSDNWSLTGRLGAYQGDLDAETTFGSFEDTSDVELYSGLSVDYRFTDNLSAQLRYDNFGIDVVALGLKLSFGR